MFGERQAGCAALAWHTKGSGVKVAVAEGEGVEDASAELDGAAVPALESLAEELAEEEGGGGGMRLPRRTGPLGQCRLAAGPQ